MSSPEKLKKTVPPIAAAIGGAAVGSLLRGRKARRQGQVVNRFLQAANARAEKAENIAEIAHEKARKDPLTGLLNGLGLEEEYGELIRRPNQDKGKNSLIELDLDNFKDINDGKGGHAAGDEVLQTVATVLKTVSRPGDIVARVGGDEIVMVLPRADQAMAVTVAERTRAAIATNSPVTASFGVTEIDPNLSFKENFTLADQALYGAKHSGRNEVVEATS